MPAEGIQQAPQRGGYHRQERTKESSYLVWLSPLVSSEYENFGDQTLELL